MAVTTNLQLPGQPGTGSTEIIPLGGDGFISPHSVTVGQVESDSDASGTSNEINIRFDTRFTQLVAYVVTTVKGTAADVNIDFALNVSSAYQAKTRVVGPIALISGMNGDIVVSWSPIPVLVVAGTGALGSPPEIRVTIPNVDNETLVINFQIFNFDRRARERTPIETLTRCLVRAESVT